MSDKKKIILPGEPDAPKIDLWGEDPGPQVVGRILVDDESCAGRGCNLENILRHEDLTRTVFSVHYKFTPGIGPTPLHAIIRTDDPLEMKLAQAMLDEILEAANIKASRLIGGDLVGPNDSFIQ